MRKRKEIRGYYTWWEIYIAWIKKLFRIKSPSAVAVSQGKYMYAYDFMVRREKDLDYKVINRGKCMLCGKELTEGIFFCKECEAKGGVKND